MLGFENIVVQKNQVFFIYTTQERVVERPSQLRKLEEAEEEERGTSISKLGTALAVVIGLTSEASTALRRKLLQCSNLYHLQSVCYNKILSKRKRNSHLSCWDTWRTTRQEEKNH